MSFNIVHHLLLTLFKTREEVFRVRVFTSRVNMRYLEFNNVLFSFYLFFVFYLRPQMLAYHLH